jgi:pilus assembly protein FimV
VGALGITSVRAWIVAASLLSICGASHAAGLGKLNVTSALGEPLKAEVELVAEKNEIGSLAARLASRDAFERAGLSYSNLLTDVKVSVEKRAGGEPYVRLTSTQPVTEPFVDLLIELTWSSGRISREFTVLLDPPSVIAERERQKASEAQVRAAPPPPQPKAEPVPAPTAEAVKPETPKTEQPAAPVAAEPATTAAAEATVPPAPTAPVETIGGTQPTLLGEGSALPSSAKSAPGVDAYGPVKSGDTLGKIASATKPADVSLEQMLVLLVRNNPHAFSGKNMNRLKTGKILQLPSSEQFDEISEADARKEVKLQARDWRAYREQLAAAAGQAAPAEQPAQQAVSGKIGAAADDKATSAKEQPKEILKLSKNEQATGETSAGVAGGDAKAAARVRALEEEVVARDKAVKESNDRVVKLEKQIKDLQALLEMKSKGMANLQKPAATPPTATTPPSPTEKAIPAQPALPAKPVPVTPAAPDVKGVTPAAPVTPAPPKSEGAPAPAQPVPAQPKPAPVKSAAAPTPEPSLIDQLLDQPAYLGGAIGVLIIIGALAARAVKRRRESKSDAEESGPARAYAETSGAGAASGDDYAGASTAAAETSQEVDPIAEAEIFLAYGRDAQAEELLTEALHNYPNRHEIHLRLLQIYTNRKDAQAFEKVARDLQQATGGAGAMWDQAVALGYEVDPDNPRYAAGKSAAGAAAAGAAAAASAAAEDVDFNIGSEDSTASTTDIDLGEADSQFRHTGVVDPAAEAAHDSTVSMKPAAIPAMDFNIDLPPAGATAPEPAAPHTASGGASALDFDIDLNSLAAPSGSAAAAPTEPSGGGGLDFDMSGLSLDAPAEPKLEKSAAAPEIDLSGISFDLGTETAPAISTSGKDDHWYDVQTKFDLAKAYQEMGDKDGAREILKEVLQEGDAEQKTAAQSVLSSLDS